MGHDPNFTKRKNRHRFSSFPDPLLFQILYPPQHLNLCYLSTHHNVPNPGSALDHKLPTEISELGTGHKLRGGGATKWEIAGSKHFALPPQDGKTFFKPLSKS